MSKRILPRLAAIALTGVLTVASSAEAEINLLNVSYDPTRELYKAINAAFGDVWSKSSGEKVTIRASHGGSGSQARAVIDGLKADVVTLALAPDIDAIAANSGRLPADWAKRLPNNSTPYTSTIVFLVRKGNPKGIKDWDDLAKPGVGVVTPNPKTSGGARWNYLAAWGHAQRRFAGDDSKVRAFVRAIYKNAPVLDTGARGSTITFAQRGVGDVLIAWENEAFLAFDEFGKDKFEIIAPPLSILAEPPVALVDANVDANRTRKAAQAYLEFLYTPAAQKIIAKNHYRPRDEAAADHSDLARFPKLELLSIDAHFGGWAAAQKAHFSEGGTFDQIYGTGAK